MESSRVEPSFQDVRQEGQEDQEDSIIFYRRRAKFQVREFNENQYFMGKCLCRTVELDEAIADYSTNKCVPTTNGGMITHAERFSKAYTTNCSEIQNRCDQTCGPGRCEGSIPYCPLSNEEIHRLLKD